MRWVMFAAVARQGTVRSHHPLRGRVATACLEAADVMTQNGTAPTTAAGPRFAGLVGRRPTVGPKGAAKQVADDLSALVRAEIELAKAEISAVAKQKGQGAALLAVAAVLGWLGLQALLILIGFLLALFLPAWAAVLIVTVLLLAGAAVAALLGRKRLEAPSTVALADNVQADVATVKAALPRRDGGGTP